MRMATRFGAARVPGLPILDPPTVQSRNQLIREDQPYYIAAGFIKLFPLGLGDYWAHARQRQQAQASISFWEWLQHLLLHADGCFQAHPRFYFFALNTALRNKALRARSYFVKRQTGMNANVSHTNEELLRMGKAQFTKIVTAFEHSLPCSSQEKVNQRSDLEALVEQIEQETHESQMRVLAAAVERGKTALRAGGESQPNLLELRESLIEGERLLATESGLADSGGPSDDADDHARSGGAGPPAGSGGRGDGRECHDGHADSGCPREETSDTAGELASKLKQLLSR